MQAARIFISGCLLLAGLMLQATPAQADSFSKRISCKFYEPGKVSLFAPAAVKHFFSAPLPQHNAGTMLQVCLWSWSVTRYDLWIPEPKADGVCRYDRFDRTENLRDNPQYSMRELFADEDRRHDAYMLLADGACPSIANVERDVVPTKDVAPLIFAQVFKSWNQSRISLPALDAMLAPGPGADLLEFTSFRDWMAKHGANTTINEIAREKPGEMRLKLDDPNEPLAWWQLDLEITGNGVRIINISHLTI